MAQTFRISVNARETDDGRVVDLLEQINQLGIPGITRATVSNLYFLRGELDADSIERIATALLVDPVVESYTWQHVEAAAAAPSPGSIEVCLHPGVTDPVAVHLVNRSHQLGIAGLDAAVTGTRYDFGEAVPADTLKRIATGLLCNDVIQFYTLGEVQPEFVPEAAPSDAVDVVPIRKLDGQALQRLSVDRVLFLSLDEMRAIQAEFRSQQRDPTDVELETLAQTWSEHCSHKTFKATIEFTCEGGMPRLLPEGVRPNPVHETIPGLIQSYLREATERLNRPWVRSAFVDNAGIIDFDDDFELSFKAETHNHPSALEPFGGANTGVGGVIRDVIGVSARPIANTDVLCFGPLDMDPAQVPAGSLHPRRIARGVVDGVEDYGNKMGIPTVAGAILYHEDYAANPLVYCGCVGIAPKGLHKSQANPGDRVVVLGGRTGRDGMHGATFSSAELTHDTGQTVGSVVQIGDPITEKAVLDAIIQARDEELYTAITDCGAGGLSSSVGEMGETVGVDVELSDVPLKYPGLRPWEIWLSEAQERMVIAVPEANLARLDEICRTYNVEWTAIGHFTGDGHLRVRYAGKLCADLDMRFLHNGNPQLTLKAVWQPPQTHVLPVEVLDDYTPLLFRLLAHPDVASKADVIHRYDHEVQGGTAGKPLVGVVDDGPGDGVVLKPWETSGTTGFALGCGINPRYGVLEPYAMAWAVVDEAMRNIVCAGADPDRTALLDNFCWGNPRLPDRLGSLVRANQGCHDAALAYHTPFISGKDSLNNEFTDVQGNKRTIPPTLLISAIGIVPDVNITATMDLKAEGNALYIVGETRDELGASLFSELSGQGNSSVPAPVASAPQTYRALFNAIRAGLISAIHDCSEGGLAVAAAEMCIAGRAGLDVSLAGLPGDPLAAPSALFSESSARFLVEVTPDQASAFEAALAGSPLAKIGKVTADPVLRIMSADGSVCINASVEALRESWQGTEVV